MSKKSNMKRTHKRRRTKAYNEAKVIARREEAAKQQEVARQAYKEMKATRRKRVFTVGAKAVIASVAIMLMFLAGLVSWSVVKNIRQRRDDMTQQESKSESQMVSSNMVTGMTRPAAKSMSQRIRFAGFAMTDGGYDGKAMFGGRVSSEGIDGLLAERDHLERLWQEAKDAREASESASIADSTKADGVAQASEANQSRYQVATTDDGSLAVGATDDEPDEGTSEESAVSDEQIRKLIESYEASSSR